MTAARITKSTLASKARDNLISILDNKSNVADPTTSSAEHRRWIYSREPDAKAANFAGYPYIIVHPTDLDVPNENRSCDMKSSKVYWTLDIDIVTSDRGYGEQDGQGLSHMDAISNDIFETVLDKTNRKTLQGYGMYSPTPLTSSVVPEVRHNERVFVRTISLEYSGKLQVSS